MCVYLRPWVMLRSQATSHVPHLADLDRVYWRVSDEEGYPGLLRRTHLAISSHSGDPRATPPWAARSNYRALRHYIRGNIVSDYGAQIIKNFLLVMAGTGKVEHEGDELNGGRVRREDLGDPGMRLGVAKVRRSTVAVTPASESVVFLDTVPSRSVADVSERDQRERSAGCPSIVHETLRLAASSVFRTKVPMLALDLSMTTTSALAADVACTDTVNPSTVVSVESICTCTWDCCCLPEWSNTLQLAV